MRARRHPYFAYGSNLCVEQMALRCPDAVDPRPAVLSDHDWLINERGVATVEPFAGNQVHGVLWQLSDHDLATLDSAEGVPVRYRRDRLTVHTDDGLVAGLGLHRPPGDPRSAPARLSADRSSTAPSTTGFRNAGSTSCAAGIPRIGRARRRRGQRPGLRHNRFRSC